MPACLHLSGDFLLAWSAVARPWFEARREELLNGDIPRAAVVLPNPAINTQLRRALAEANLSTAGVTFLTSARLREELLRHAGAICHRADHTLVLHSLCTREAPASPRHRAWQHDPEHLRHASELALMAGADAERLLGGTAAALTAEARQCLNDAGYLTPAQALRQLPAELPCVRGHLLLFGFTSTAWPDFLLLQAALRTARKTELVLLEESPEPPAAAWLGRWEELLGPAKVYLELTDARAPTLLLAEDSAAEAPLIAAQVTADLAAGAGQITVLVPDRGELARLVAEELSRRSLPFADGVRQRAAPPLRQRLLESWFAYQREASAASLLAFAERLAEAGLWPRDSLPQLRSDLGSATELLLADAVDVLLQALPEEPLFLRAWPLLLAHSSLPDLLAAARESLAALGWGNELEGLPASAPFCQTLLRADFLAWLEARLLPPSDVPAPGGAHLLAPVQLIPWSQAQGLCSSHFILAGLNEKSLTSDTSPWIEPERVDPINRQALREAPSGRGELTLAAGRAWMLTRVQANRACLHALSDLIQRGRHVTLIGTLPKGPALSQRGPLLPLFLTHLPEGVCPTQFVRRLPAETIEPLPAPQRDAFLEITRNRLDSRTPFESTSSLPLELTCREWERALEKPEEVLYSAVFRARNARAQASPPPLARVMGTWVHQWLRHAASRDLPQRASAPPADAPRETRERVFRAWARLERPMPQYWREAFAAAEGLFQAIRRLLGSNPGYPWELSEWRLPDGLTLETAAGPLLLRGVVDRLLLDHPERPSAALLLDFKTGKPVELKSKAVREKGTRLQVALYALAAARHFGCEVGAALIHRESTELAPQLTTADLDSPVAVFDGLAEASRKATLGRLTNPSDEHGAEFPFAALPIDKAILAAKWRLTHPDLPL